MRPALPRLLPGPRLLPLLALWVVLALAATLWPDALRAWWGAGALLAAALLLEAALLLRQPVPACRREIAPVVPLGCWRDVVLEFSHAGRRALPLYIHDHHPDSAETEGLPLACTLPPRARTRLAYRLRCNRRGVQRFAGVDLRLPGRLGLLARQVFLPETTTLRVYPNFAEVARYALLAQDNRLSQLGIRLRRRRGTGLEFHQLREYREGDALRQIDWKATSRLRKLIAREYQDERDQQVLLLLDAGFRMRSQDDRLSHFDAALNALLLLTHVVIRQGDAVGLMTFANEEERFQAPAKGHATLARMMNAVFDLEPGAASPDFVGAATALGQHLRKRSLVVILTSVRDEDGDDLREACALLARQHVVLVANLREAVLDTLDEALPGDVDAALTTAATHLYLQARDRTLRHLQHAGVVVLDTRPDRLAVGLINRYLEIKRSGRL
ncbi:MAG TPA: DUF58 domain-containing protein [Moraxellaceae bacterium]|nr:DUF58 domain-containing protein [Moraxellaceae bacterium]